MPFPVRVHCSLPISGHGRAQARITKARLRTASHTPSHVVVRRQRIVQNMMAHVHGLSKERRLLPFKIHFCNEPGVGEASHTRMHVRTSTCPRVRIQTTMHSQNQNERYEVGKKSRERIPSV